MDMNILCLFFFLFDIRLKEKERDLIKLIIITQKKSGKH